MSGMILLMIAYALVGVFVFGYLFWLIGRQEKLRREIETLWASLEGRGERRSGG